MVDDEDVLNRVEMAIQTSKRIRREATISVQQLARLRDHLQPENSAQGEEQDGRYYEEDR